MKTGGIDVARLATGRIELRPLRVEDAEQMVRVLGDSALYRFTGGEPPALGALRSRYRRLVAGRSKDGEQVWLNWIIRLRREGVVVGTMQATVMDDGVTAQVAWVVGTAWQGRGIATESARLVIPWLGHRGVATVTASIHADHIGSQRVAAKSGLVPTGVLHDGETVWSRRIA